MNDVLFRLCRHHMSLIDGWIPYPSTCLSKVCGLTLYQTRKELKKLKEQGFVTSERYCEVGEDGNILIAGYVITDKAKKTEEYKKAYEEECALCKECFGFDIGECDAE